MTAAVAAVMPGPQHDADEESDERTERDLDVRVQPAGERDAAARFGEAEDDEPHRDGAHEVRERRGGPERRRGGGGKPKDSAADREVDDARRETPDAEGANERTFVCVARHMADGGRLRS